MVNHIFTGTVDKIAFQFRNILAGIAFEGTVIGDIQVDPINPHTPSICPQAVIGVYQDTHQGIVADRGYVIRRKEVVDTRFTIFIPLQQTALYQGNPKISVFVFIHRIHRRRGIVFGIRTPTRPQFCLKPLRRKQVDATGFSTQPNGLTIGKQAVDGIAVDGNSHSFTGLTNERESIRVFIIDIQSVKGGYNQVSPFRQFDIRYIGLAQHPGAVGGVTITFQTLPGMVVFE